MTNLAYQGISMLVMLILSIGPVHPYWYAICNGTSEKLHRITQVEPMSCLLQVVAHHNNIVPKILEI